MSNTRAHVVWLTAFAALLVLDGGAAVSGPDVVPQMGDVSPAQLAARLSELNPSLTVQQRERIASAIVKYAAKYELDPALVYAVLEKESSGRPWARSPKGAIGLMQVMPYMGASVGVAGNLAQIETNIEAGCYILADNIRRLGEERGILAYFWGNEIRGAAYLERVEAARAALLEETES